MSDSVTIFSILGDDNLLNNKHNEAFVCSEYTSEDDGDDHYDEPDQRGGHHTPPPVRHEPHHLSITTHIQPKNPALGYVIGRDPAVCDIVLDHERVSERLFAIRPVPEYKTILLQNLYYYGTRANFYRLGTNGTVKKARIFLENERIDITLFDNVKITIQRKNDPHDWAAFCSQLGEQVQSSQPATASGRPAAQPRSNQKVKEYIKDRSLGKGAFGEVHRVVEKYTGKVYAMKVYNQSERARWQESAMMDRLRHKHIVRFVEYLFTAGQSPRLIMEYVDGSDLENVLANQGSLPLVLSEKKDILHQLLEATAHIHKSGVTHRDIKPANVMLATRSPIHIVLVDFGLSTGQGQFNTTCGTPLYSAAELLIKNQHATNKVDMYAVGVIALQLMYGFHFSRIENRDFRSCLAAIREQRIIMEAKWPRNRLPHPFSFIRRLLSEEPSERPSALKCLEEPYFQNPLPEEVQVMDYHEQPIAPYQGPQGHGGLISTTNLRQPNLASQYFGDPGRSSSHLASPILGRRQTPTSSLLPPPKRLRMDQPVSRHENHMPSMSAERQLFFMNSEDYIAPYPPPPLATKERTGLSSIQLPSIFASKGSHRSTDQISPHTGGVTSHDTTVHNGSTRTSHPGADTGAPTTEQSTAAPSKMSIHSISSPTGSGGYSESGSQQDMLTNQCWYDPMTSMGGGSLMQLVGNNRQQGTTQGQTNAHMGHPENSFLIQSMSYSFLNGDPATIGQQEPNHTSAPQPAAGTTNGHNPVQQYNGTHHHQVAHYQNSHIPTPQHDTPQYHKPIQQAPHQHQITPLHGTPLHGTPLHGTPRHDALPYPTPHDAVPSPHAVNATNMRPTVKEGQTVQAITDATPVEPREDSESTPFSPKEAGGRRDSATMKRRKATSLGDKEKLAREYRLNPRPSKADFRRIQKTVHMTYKQIRIWFQNRRYQDLRASERGEEISTPDDNAKEQ